MSNVSKRRVNVMSAPAKPFLKRVGQFGPGGGFRYVMVPCDHQNCDSSMHAYDGPIDQPVRENRAAHGNVCKVELCRDCGAKRFTNINQQHTETSGWR